MDLTNVFVTIGFVQEIIALAMLFSTRAGVLKVLLVTFTTYFVCVTWVSSHELGACQRSLNAQHTVQTRLFQDVREYRKKLDEQYDKEAQATAIIARQDSIIMINGWDWKVVAREAWNCASVLENLKRERRTLQSSMDSCRIEMLHQVSGNPNIDSATVMFTMNIFDEVAQLHDSTYALINVLERHVRGILQVLRLDTDIKIQDIVRDAFELLDRKP